MRRIPSRNQTAHSVEALPAPTLYFASPAGCDQYSHFPHGELSPLASLSPAPSLIRGSSKPAAMANAGSVALLSFLVAAFLLVSPGAASTDAPFMVVHKKVDLSRLKSGAEQVSVSIDIYNQGSATAYDVSLNDDIWDKDTFDLVSGSTSNSWERLDSGSITSHAFVLESKVKGVFHGAPAVVKFRVPTKTALQEAYSTPILPLDILADKPPVKKFDWAKKLLAKYGSLVSVLGFVALFVYLIASPAKSGGAKSKKKR